MDAEESITVVSCRVNKRRLKLRIVWEFSWHFVKTIAFYCWKMQFSWFSQNGAQAKDDEMKWNHKKRTKDCFLMFCEVVLQHEHELLSEVSFCIFYLFLFCEKKSNSLKFSIFCVLFIAINRLSTHHRNQLTRIGLRKCKITSPSRIQPSIRTRTELQMEKSQHTQMVSVHVSLLPLWVRKVISRSSSNPRKLSVRKKID